MSGKTMDENIDDDVHFTNHENIMSDVHSMK